MPFTLAERAAVAALFWARHPRRNDDAIRGAVRGLSGEDLEDVRLRTGAHEGLTDDELVALMTELASEAARVATAEALPCGSIPAEHRKHLLIRADGAGATHRLLDWLSGLGQVRGRQVEHSVGFPDQQHRRDQRHHHTAAPGVDARARR